jgi:NAD(P)-dependent dehydrogenase (short-subunit alcohol dehydrogenase family)
VTFPLQNAAWHGGRGGHIGYSPVLPSNGKAAMEQWVRVVRSELDHRRSATWVVAIRPGAVDTPSMRDYAEVDPVDNPTAAATKAALESGQVDSADVAARRMWDVIVDGANAEAIVLLGEMIAPPRPV